MNVFLDKIIRLFKLKGLAIRALSLLTFVVLKALKMYKKIIFIPLMHHRAGHLAANTDLFLRRFRDGYYSFNNIYIGICGQPAANQQLVNIFKRHLRIIESNIVKDIVSVKPIKGSEFLYLLPFNTNEYSEFSGKAVVHFSDEEKEKGEKFLAQMGISQNDWFVCFYARDSRYLERDISNEQNNYGYHEYRNSDINNCLKAAEYIANQGGFAVRVGSVIEKPLPAKRHPRIIDYAADFRSDFMDVFLAANCKFFIGHNSGIILMSQIFNVPTAQVNLIPFSHVPLASRDIYIPKKMWCRKRKRILTFKEIIKNCMDYDKSEQYKNAGIAVIENDPDDILDLTIEMNERLDGKFRYSAEDKKLQNNFRALFKPNHRCYGFLSRIGAHFLRKNRELLADVN